MNNERKIRVWCSIWLIMVCLSGNSETSPDNEAVEFRGAGYQKSVSLGDIKSKLKSVYAPYYKKQKSYRAFRLNDVLELGYPFDMMVTTRPWLSTYLEYLSQ